MDLASDHVRDRRSGAAIGNVCHIDARGSIEQCAGKVRRRTHSCRAVLQLGPVRLGIGDELRQGFGRKVFARNQHEWLFGDEPDRSEIGSRIVGQLLVEGRIVGMRPDSAEQHRITVRHGVRDAVDADDTRGGADVLDDHLLAQYFAQSRRNDPRDHVEGAARGKWNHQGDRPRRIRLRPSHARDGR
jgi:hypothetical protein